jgi:hypothetical protein
VLAAREDSGQRLLEALEDRVDRELQKACAEILGERLRVGAGLRGGEPRRHRDGMHPLRPERLDRQGDRQRRVDPTRDADDDLVEAVLLHVVTEPELQGAPHLLELVQGVGDERRDQTRLPPLLAEIDDGRVGNLPLPRESPPASIDEAAGDRRRCVDVDDE